MKVEINIDETQFKELFKDGMLRRALERIIQLYTDKSHFIYELLQKLVKDCDYSKLQDVLDIAIKNLEENNERILKNMFIEAIAGAMYNTYSFKDSISKVLMEITNR